MPQIITRAQWGARNPEAIQTVSTGKRANFMVHHSGANPNQSVRAIQDFHMDTRGWSDIGYNFLVDACGQVFEGRYGGIMKNVVGAHSAGFNTGSVGVAVIGDFSKMLLNGLIIMKDAASGTVTTLRQIYGPDKSWYRAYPGIAVDASGNLLIPDWSAGRALRWDAITGTFTTVGDNGVPTNMEMPATGAELYQVRGVAADGEGTIAFISDSRLNYVEAGTGILRYLNVRGESLAMSRDGMLWRGFRQVSTGGTPRPSLLMSALATALMLITGTFPEARANAPIAIRANTMIATEITATRIEAFMTRLPRNTALGARDRDRSAPDRK